MHGGFSGLMIPDDMTETVTALKDQFFDLRGLSAYSALAVSTLRDHIKSGSLPCFKVKGKILVKKSEFDVWLEGFRLNKKQDLQAIVDGVMEGLRG